MMKGIIFGAVVLVLSACASGKNLGPTYTYNELLVVNNSQQPIRGLTISVADGNHVYSCDDIAALRVCSKRFGRHRYTQAPFSVAWAFGNNERQTNEVEIKVPAYSSTGIALRAVFEISPQGTISAYFEQITPF